MGKAGAKRLGRGLSSLIRPDLGVVQEVGDDPGGETSIKPTGSAASRSGVSQSLGLRALTRLPLEQIRTNPSQPRRVFDESRLAALAASIGERGALQPIVVRPVEGGYELVAGERRLRASRLAGLADIPVIVRNVRDDDMLELALIENVQREDLNPIEKARGYRTLVQKYGLSHDDVAVRMGEDRSSVANTIRILGLADGCLKLIASGELSVGHGKVLLGVADSAEQTALADRIVAQGWSVRRTETEVSDVREAASPTAKPPTRRESRPAVTEMEEVLSSLLGTRVSIREGRRRHSGKITIEYYNLDDFERITTALGVDPETPNI